ncbi:GntP family permease [Desulfotomaculum copahuensis]|uniref:Transporter n=1 Tax=Desulfotomaculum copahuensis TaxID=1838280 RepID=A0A1B7LHB2_9FIRM|nr:GntP family permease [Desulfotomaculum copahuensis]OAT85593.1 transporter [Desulfotomaculum copahuensis]
MEVIGILLSLGLLMFFAYRGFSVILFAPVFALLAAFFSGAPLLPSYTELFLVKAAGYFKSFFPIFLLGAVFGKVMEDTGAASSIARSIIKAIGRERAILAVVLACMVLTYGGVSLFVVAFAVYPFAAALFKEAGIPKRLIPGVIALGSFTVTMDALPGTPQIQNVIPTKYFGTNLYAAPVTGVIGSVIILALGLLWMEYRRKKARAGGEGYGQHTLNEPEPVNGDNLPHPLLSALPLLAVLAGNLFFTRWISGWDGGFLKPYGVTLASVQSTWSLILALVLGVLLAIGINYGRIKGQVAKSLNAGTIGSLLAILNTSSEVGFGSVIASLSGFKAISAAMLGIKGSPLLSEALTVNVLAGVTGSASGGMSIALEIAGKQYLEWAQRLHISPDVLHRIASMASGGMDTLPHNGAVITLLAICGLTHKDAYKDIFAVTVIKTLTVFLLVLLHSMFVFS